MNITFLTRCILFVLLVGSSSSSAQQGNRFCLNISNGLPNNHIYTSIIDKHGYLWIATPSGVIRYNGYELKSFSTYEGLPTDDVWQLLEDDNGKIWLGSIADKFGYIYNDKYYPAKFTDTNYHTIYPTHMSRVNGGIIFLSSYLKDNLVAALCIEKNDTIQNYSLIPSILETIPRYMELSKETLMMPVITSTGKCYGIFNDSIYSFAISKNHLSMQLQCIKGSLHTLISKNQRVIAGNYIFFYGACEKNRLIYMNLNTGRSDTIFSQLPIEKLQGYSIKNKDYVSIFTNSNIIDYKINDTNVEYITTTNLNKYVTESDVKMGNLSLFLRDVFWGRTIYTIRNSGLQIQYDIKEPYTWKKELDLNNFNFTGTSINGSGVWWNATTSEACLVNDQLKYRTIKVDMNQTPKNINALNSYCFHVGNMNTFYDVSKNCIVQINKKEFSLNKYFQLPGKENSWICMSNFGIQKLDPQIGLPSAVYIDTDRYNNIIYDSLRKSIWAYNPNKLLIYNNDKKKTYTRSQILQFGVNRIEKIVLDKKYGNVFLKSNNQLSIYDIDNKSSRELFRDINLKECSIDLSDDIMCIYGRFGVLFCKIYSKGKISNPILYPNIKNFYFNYIYDVQLTNKRLIISTDRSVYSIDIPRADSLYEKTDTSLFERYKFVCYYKNVALNVHSGDTLKLSQNELRIRFDLINPYGNGELKYEVVNGQKNTELNANEYNLPQQSQLPDHYYKVTLLAYDKVWRSAPLDLYIYIQPYWWQTKNMQITIWITGSLFVIFLFTVSILITRRLVLNASMKRNLRMEMELKAIYSQINPHFIFNSLNSALLLVSKNRMDEAYTHISKFSKLLRSYIKSSRNKFITAEEEIINLQNYIELQQIRFKDRFSYEIDTAHLTNRSVKIPSLLLQPFVENAIEHGLLNNIEKGHLLVKFNMTDDTTLVCIIDDNGIGREESKKISGQNVSKEESYGNLLVKDLVNIFNKYESVHVEISYIDKLPPLTGTVVSITIKYPR